MSQEAIREKFITELLEFIQSQDQYAKQMNESFKSYQSRFQSHFAALLTDLLNSKQENFDAKNLAQIFNNFQQFKNELCVSFEKSLDYVYKYQLNQIYQNQSFQILKNSQSNLVQQQQQQQKQQQQETKTSKENQIQKEKQLKSKAPHEETQSQQSQSYQQSQPKPYISKPSYLPPPSQKPVRYITEFIDSIEETALTQKMLNFVENTLKHKFSDNEDKYLEKSINSYQSNGPFQISSGQRTKAWYYQRSLRLTASNFGILFNKKSFDQVDIQVYSFQNPNSMQFTSDAMEYGTNTEEIARQQYQKKYPDRTVTDTGFWSNSEMCWLGGSPDGLIKLQNGSEGLLEIKCPYNGKELNIKGLMQKRAGKSDFFLKYKGNDKKEIVINKKHGYYFQIQGCMAILNKQWCDFVVYTQIDLLDIRVERDQSFINKVLPVLKEYYFKYYLPELVNPTFHNNKPFFVLPSDAYSKIFENI